MLRGVTPESSQVSQQWLPRVSSLSQVTTDPDNFKGRVISSAPMTQGTSGLEGQNVLLTAYSFDMHRIG